MTGWDWKDFSGYKIPVPGMFDAGGKSQISNGDDLWGGSVKDSDLEKSSRARKEKRYNEGRGNKPGY